MITLTEKQIIEVTALVKSLESNRNLAPDQRHEMLAGLMRMYPAEILVQVLAGRLVEQSELIIQRLSPFGEPVPGGFPHPY